MAEFRSKTLKLIKKIAKKILTEESWSKLRLAKIKTRNRYLGLLPKLTEIELKKILETSMRLKKGDTVFLTSSIQELRLNFAPSEIIDLTLDLIGPEGTLCMPTYTKGPARGFLERGETFDVRYTPSMTGLLTELFRRRSGIRRSLHPTKSVAALGPKADYLTSEHHLSPWPYGPQSPYARLVKLNAKIIGLGVTSTMITIVHAVEDYLQEKFPVSVNDPRLFKSAVIDQSGKSFTVGTYAHSNVAVLHDIPAFCAKYLPELVYDFSYKQIPFFAVEARPAFEKLTVLARQGITIYPKSQYKQ